MKTVFEIKSRFDGLPLSVAVVEPDGEAVAVLQIAHGMCGSKERFLPFMQYLAGHGIVCLANDHRGHGDSIVDPSDRGYMYNGGSEALIDDLAVVADRARRKYPALPFFMLGHSMGALAIWSFLNSRSDLPDGIILCGTPGYSPFAPLVLKLSGIMCRSGLGRMRPGFLQKIVSESYNRDFRSEGPKAWVSSNPEVCKIFSEDPRHNFLFTVDGLHTLMGLMTETHSCRGLNNSSRDIPVFMLSGEDDPCMRGRIGLDKAASQMRDSGLRNVSIKTYPAMRHEILNEIGKERVWQDILGFILQ